MSNDEPEPHDYCADVIAMLTLRINIPPGEWLNDRDAEIFASIHQEAVDVDGAEEAAEFELLAMMNAAWLAIQYLASVTGEAEAVWLERIAVDMQLPGA